MCLCACYARVWCMLVYLEHGLAIRLIHHINWNPRLELGALMNLLAFEQLLQVGHVGARLVCL